MPIYMDWEHVPELKGPQRQLVLEVIEADFAEPRSIEVLAEAQRRFLAKFKGPLEDVDLPPDD